MRSTGMGVTETLGIGLHASSVQRATSGGWKYDGPCPDAGVGWTRVKKYRICSRQGPRVDYEYVAPNGKRFRSLVAAQKHSSQLAQDCTVACATCGSEECTPGNDIVICDGTCGLAFHQQYSRYKVLLLAAAHVDTHCATRLLRAALWARRESPLGPHRQNATEEAAAAFQCVLTLVEPHRLWTHRHCLVDPLWEVPAGEWRCPACGPGEWLSPVDDSIPVPRLRAAASSPVLEPTLYKPGQHVMTRPLGSATAR